jgi:twitching motility protein PilJ
MASIASALKLPSLTSGKWTAKARNARPTEAEVCTDNGKDSAETEVENPVTPRSLFNRFSNSGVFAPFWHIPLIGRLPFSRQVEILSISIAVLLLLTLAAFGASVWDSRLKREQARVANDVQLLSQRVANLAQQAAFGDAEAFTELQEHRDRLVGDLTLLTQGGTRYGVDLPAPSETEERLLLGIAETWHRIDEQVNQIYRQQPNLLQLRKQEEIVEKSGVKVLSLSQSLLHGVVDRGEDFRAVAWTRQLYADVLNFDLLDAKSLVSTDQPTPQVALQLAKNVGSFIKTLRGLLDGNAEAGISPLQHPVNRDTATELLKSMSGLKASIDGIVKNMVGIAQAKQAGRDISKGTQDMEGRMDSLTNSYRDSGTGWGGILTGVLFTMFTLVGLALIAKLLLDDVRARALKNEMENRRNEQAILRLLDDMSDLAEGNLTKHARVTEDMTGAIADSVNYAIDELRSLVTQINSAASHLTDSSTQGKAVSVHLLQVAQKQAHQIEEAAASVLQMTSSMDAVSDDASKCAAVAEQSLASSGKGGAAVQDSIASMNELREQIQETSKRIKRLGESSQEISEIVQLIAAITEQTNVLALNAAIQAAAAGEAGRGFTVVAEEVQRLAERSGEATKQIAAIVKAIQHDTQDAVAAMEKSTHGVVRGAQLTDSAGQALDEIRDVSHRLADLVASISSSTLGQRQVAKQLAQRMHDLLNITTQSTKGTKWTAESMAQISDLATNLKVSVSGFRV